MRLLACAVLSIAAACAGRAAPAPAAQQAARPAPPLAEQALPRGSQTVGWRLIDVRDETRRVRPGFDGSRPGPVRRLPVQIWYPALPQGPAATYADYAAGEDDSLRGELRLLGAAPEAAGKLLAAARPVRRGAPAAPGRFPLALWVGGSSGARAAAPLAEVLASHGWVVAAFPATSRHARIQFFEDEVDKLDTRVRDLEAVIAALAREPGVDARRPALIGFSSEAPAAVVYDMRNRAGAVVSLDGWEGRMLGARAMALVKDADPAYMRAPYLLIESRDEPGERDLTLIGSARHALRWVVTAPLDHFDLVPLRHAAGVRAGEALPAYTAALALAVEFLDHHVRGGPAPALPAGARSFAAVRAQPDRIDIARALFDRSDAAAAVRMLAEADLEESELNAFGYELLGAGRTRDAIAILAHVTERFPRSANAFDSLAEAQLADGQRDRAIASYRAALERNPSFPSAHAALARLGVQVPGARAASRAPDYRLVLRPPARVRPRVTTAELRPGQVIEVHHGPAGGPVVLFLNGVGVPLRTWEGYQDWARLVVAGGMNAVLYDGATVEDAEAALAYLGENAARLRIASDRLCVFASSANGRVGVRLPLRPAGKPIDCAVYYYPILDVSVVRPDLPVLLVRTGIDTRAILASIEAWIAVAVGANARFEVINLPRHQHGFDARDDDDESRRVIRATVDFFATHLGANPRSRPAARTAPR